VNSQITLCIKTLGLSGNPSESDIKRAYRKKAKELHPDINPSSRAHEEFQQITKAYTYLLAYKAGKIRPNPDSNSPKSNNQDKRYGTHSNWNSEANVKAREAAKSRAKEKYEEYINSEEHYHSLLFSKFFTYLAFGLVLLIGILICWFLISGAVFKLAGTVLLSLVGFPLWWAYVRNQTKNMSVKEFKLLLRKVSETYQFWVIILGLTNFLLFLNFGLYTTLSTNLVILGFIALVTGTFYYARNRLHFNSSKSKYWAIGVIPLVLNMLFVVNYTFSGAPVKATYPFQYTPYEGDGSTFSEGLIFLPKNTYESAYFLRAFYLRESTGPGTVSYTTARGLFGVEVVLEAQILYYNSR